MLHSLTEFSNVTLFKKWGRFTLPAKKSHVKEGDDNSGKILALLGGCDRNTLKKWRANVRTARRLYLVSPASALIGAVLLCGMIEEVMLKHICEDSTRRHMQSCESATIDAKLVKSNVLLKSCSRLCCLDAQNYFPCRAPRAGLEGRRGTSFCKSGKVLSHRDGFAPHFKDVLCPLK